MCQCLHLKNNNKETNTKLLVLIEQIYLKAIQFDLDHAPKTQISQGSVMQQNGKVTRFPIPNIKGRICGIYTEAPFLDLHLSVANGFVSSKIYDKRDDFDFDLVTFPF